MPNKNNKKVYIVAQYVGGSDGWEAADAESDIIYVTQDKKKLDDFMEALGATRDYTKVVKVDMDKDYTDKAKLKSANAIAEWYDGGPMYDDPWDI